MKNSTANLLLDVTAKIRVHTQVWVREALRLSYAQKKSWHRARSALYWTCNL